MKKQISETLKIGMTANILEWYDFSIYASMASIMGDVFFSGHDKKLALIKALIVFSVSYLARPLGSFFFGYLADKYGRSLSLRTSLIAMAIPTVLIGFLPQDNQILFISVIALLILRIIQGFAAGGELPSSACYIYEIAPQHQKNLLCSFVSSSSMFGVFTGSLVVYLLHILFSESQIQTWAWRIPFWIGGILAIFIYQLRKSVQETDEFKNNAINTKNNFVEQLLQSKIQIAQVFFLNAFLSSAFYLLFVWMPSYLHVFLNLSSENAYLSNSIGLLSLVFFALLLGSVIKDNQRKKSIIFGIIFLLVFSYPLFLLLNQKNLALTIFVQFIFAFGASFIASVIYATINSLFDVNVRCSGISIGFTLSTAIFGGLSPTVCAYLIYETGYHLSPIIFLITTGLAALIATLSLPRAN